MKAYTSIKEKSRCFTTATSLKSTIYKNIYISTPTYRRRLASCSYSLIQIYAVFIYIPNLDGIFFNIFFTFLVAICYKIDLLYFTHICDLTDNIQFHP